MVNGDDVVSVGESVKIVDVYSLPSSPVDNKTRNRLIGSIVNVVKVTKVYPNYWARGWITDFSGNSNYVMFRFKKLKGSVIKRGEE